MSFEIGPYKPSYRWEMKVSHLLIKNKKFKNKKMLQTKPNLVTSKDIWKVISHLHCDGEIRLERRTKLQNHNIYKVNDYINLRKKEK
jgi:hypothetical protein